MSIRAMSVFGTVSIAAMAAASVWAWAAAPEISQIAVHWNLSGEAVAYRSKEVALTLAPGIALALSIAMAAMTGRADAGDVWSKRARAVWFAGLLALSALHVFLVLAAAGLITVFGNYTALPPAVFIGVMGNYMVKGGTTQQRATGRLLVLTSLATIATWGVVPGPAAELVIVAGTPLSMVLGLLFKVAPENASLQNGA